MIDILSLPLPALTVALADWNLPAYRTGQIFRWLQRGVERFDDMSDLPKPLRERLNAECALTLPTAARVQTDSDGTQKTLWTLGDGAQVESVLMRYQHGNSLCLSTQVGCRMGCRFCASTIDGRVRDLTAGEMLGQVLMTKNAVQPVAEGSSVTLVSHVVLMGIGEPLDNLDNVLPFLTLLRDGQTISLRHVSVSTCGLPGGIERLMREKLSVTLSVSLHAPDDETRDKLMPVNKSCNIKCLLDLCKTYAETTGRRISYEYLLIDGVNDSLTQARQLARLLRGHLSHINLIPWNPVPGLPWKPSPRSRVSAFLETVMQNGVACTLRRRLGQEIDAACGQLRRQSAR